MNLAADAVYFLRGCSRSRIVCNTVTLCYRCAACSTCTRWDVSRQTKCVRTPTCPRTLRTKARVGVWKLTDASYHLPRDDYVSLGAWKRALHHVMQWRTERGGLGCSNPPPRNSEDIGGVLDRMSKKSRRLDFLLQFTVFSYGCNLLNKGFF